MEEIEGFFRDGIPARQWRMQPKLDGRLDDNSKEVLEEKGDAKGWEDTTRA
jgi:hypothetical protein